MAIQIHGNYDHSGADYAERVKENRLQKGRKRQRKQRKLLRKKMLVSCPNHGMNTSAVKNRGRSLRDCTG